ncbi:MAG: hypothetical protein VXZ98_06170 [Pseudomonadota bacterium]|nr:hypothetical protein [Pseudomonadota bacterium]
MQFKEYFAGATLFDPLPEKVKVREAQFPPIWNGCELRNDRIKAALGLEFRSLDESIRDCVESLITIGGVKPVLKRGLVDHVSSLSADGP